MGRELVRGGTGPGGHRAVLRRQGQHRQGQAEGLEERVGAFMKQFAEEVLLSEAFNQLSLVHQDELGVLLLQ